MIRNTCVEAEIGRIPCVVYGRLASALKPREYIHSISAEELEHLVVPGTTYRKSTAILNRAFHRAGDRAFRTSTLEDHIVSDGQKINAVMHAKAQAILREVPGISETGMIEDAAGIPECIKSPAPGSDITGTDKDNAFADVVSKYNEGKEDCDQIKNRKLIADTELNPADCVYVSIDEVGVHHQKDARGDGGKKNGKNVENTVIHIQCREGEYTLTDICMDKAFTLLMAFLFANRLLEDRHLYFFSDGAQNIKSKIETYFKELCPYSLMLDWYHLEKRMTELLSMALQGSKDIRHDIRHTLDQKLWAGNIDDAIKYLNGLDKKYVRNQNKLDDAIKYLDRKRLYVACYALRRELGYRNSSNPAEKANDIIVASRQKHNGMSWSYAGSGALASITALSRNGETMSWITDRKIAFVPRPSSKDNMAA